MTKNLSALWLTRLFVFSAVILLLITGVAKLISAFGTAYVLQSPEPITGFSFRAFFLVTGTIEIIAALFCLLTKQAQTRIRLVALLATNFMVYRIAVYWTGYHLPCPCLGDLAGALRISASTADLIMKCVLAYLIIGSYGALAHYTWEQNRQTQYAAIQTP